MEKELQRYFLFLNYSFLRADVNADRKKSQFDKNSYRYLANKQTDKPDDIFHVWNFVIL